MKKYLNVMIDTETLSRRPSAAIIQIAAKPFMMKGGTMVDDYRNNIELSLNIDATSCAMYGMDFDMQTVTWWAKNTSANTKFKLQLDDPYPIERALHKFSETLRTWLTTSDADELKIWCQGTDFDIALLREAYRTVYGSEDRLPWAYRNVRDARTYFLEAVALFAPNEPDYYELIKTDGTKHDAVADCDWSIKAVQWAYEKYTQRPAGDTD